MKYWLYSEGNILGPYPTAELLCLPAFDQGSLVCPETSTGDNPGDWRAAEQVSEIGEALSVGVGGVISARSGGPGALYELETGLSSAASYYGAGNDRPYGYENLLNTIDNVLGAYKDAETPAEPGAAPDYELMDRFDVRLAKIQEELEAARWEKNLLLEKIRAREAGERKDKERIAELEEKLKAMPGAVTEAYGPQTAKAMPGAVTEAYGPQTAKAMPGADAEEEKTGSPFISRKLKSLGRGPAASFASGNEASRAEAPVVPPVPAPSEPAPAEPLEPPSRQASGLVYDFTVMSKKAPEPEKETIQFTMETWNEPASVPLPQQPVQQVPPRPGSPAPQVQPVNVWRPAPTPSPAPAQAEPPATVKPQPAFAAPAQGRPMAALTPEPLPGPVPAGRNADAGSEKIERITVAPLEQNEEVKKTEPPAKKSRGKLAFLATLLVFAAVAAGGLGYFFLGSGVSFSEFSMMNFGGGQPKKTSFSTQLDVQEGKTAPTEAGEKAPVQPAVNFPQEGGGPGAAPVKPAFESVSNETTRKALEIVKTYKLSGGRGTVAGWFANSFLSNSATGSNEEWSATILHGDIFVVQYRLLRPKQDPLVYQFEVDVPKGLIVRGINNNAIDLLDFSSRATASAAPAPARKAGKTAPRPVKPRDIPILPLPEGPAAGPAQEVPTGFEAATPEANEKVRYIMAQESDEELF